MRWTKEEVDILKKYYTVMIAIDIQKKYLPNRTLIAIISKSGRIGLIKRIKGIEWKSREINILKKYYGKELVVDIQVKYLKHRTIRAIIHKAYEIGLKSDRKIYTCNQNFFSEPNIVNSYWAGFIAADGCIYKKRNTNDLRLSIGLQLSDYQHLQKILKCMQSDSIVRKYPQRNYCEMALCNEEEIINDLQNIFSITERKSLTLQSPNIYKEDQIRAFIRGYFDGDGCLSFNKSLGHNSWIVTIASGSKDILMWIQRCMEYFLPDIKCNLCRGSGVNNLAFSSSKQSIRFLEWLYYDSINLTRLNRKYKLFLQFKKEYTKKRDGLTSKYNCVYHKRDKWESGLTYKNKYFHVGTFLTEKEAAVAYNAKARELGLFDRCYEVN